ncbi:hypothetical protein OsJ_24769 [Oryza sativa Japonica Group]|uniref:Uncharacterized protein n=1 Tax=Oryza sativa subsp. japonica TaxID=39947 RepID=A3BL84_ORYSJ|nr:hypothetical protein OsJ_24769 [Oryza sativa Japonica Group]
MAPAAGTGSGPGTVVVGSAAALAAQEEMRWRQLDSGVSAVSFGFVATAILVSMFLAMAILEHFLRSPAHRGHAGMGPPPPHPPPPGGILSRLRLLLHRRGAGEAAFPGGSDLEAARKLDGGASPEVYGHSEEIGVAALFQDNSLISLDGVSDHNKPYPYVMYDEPDQLHMGFVPMLL